MRINQQETPHAGFGLRGQIIKNGRAASRDRLVNIARAFLRRAKREEAAAQAIKVARRNRRPSGSERSSARFLTSHLGLFFADPTTLYVADEGRVTPRMCRRLETATIQASNFAPESS